VGDPQSFLKARNLHQVLFDVLRSQLSIVVVLAVIPWYALAAQPAQQSSIDSAYVAGAFRAFTGAGDSVSLGMVVAAMQFHEVVFVGETHDDPTAHLVELKLLRAIDSTLAASDPNEQRPRDITLSVEFFQRDVQGIVDEYLAGLITEKAFLGDVRPWPRYMTDYRPLIEYARNEGLKVVAANAPRRYANLVTRRGKESLQQLSPDAQFWLPPLPFPEASDEYRDQWISAVEEVVRLEQDPCGRSLPDSLRSEDSTTVSHHPSIGHHDAMGNQFDAQLLWDATMGYSIADHLLRSPEDLVIHIVGSFHVERGTGAPEYLEIYRPGSSAMTVVIRPVDDIERFEPAPDGQWGDFVIQTERSRTVTAIECRLSESRP
jgi:uncharacterized iron-regulated protein